MIGDGSIITNVWVLFGFNGGKIASVEISKPDLPNTTSYILKGGCTVCGRTDLIKGDGVVLIPNHLDYETNQICRGSGSLSKTLFLIRKPTRVEFP